MINCEVVYVFHHEGDNDIIELMKMFNEHIKGEGLTEDDFNLFLHYREERAEAIAKAEAENYEPCLPETAYVHCDLDEDLTGEFNILTFDNFRKIDCFDGEY